MKSQGDKQKKVDETFKHWGYGSGIEQTAVSAKGTTLNLDDMNSPKDYLTDRIKKKILSIIKNYAGEGNDDFVNKLVALLTSEVEKIADMIKSTNNLRMAKVDGKDDWNDALEQSACKMDALEKEVRKALSDIGGKDE